MGDRVTFWPELLRFEEVAVSHSDTDRSIRFYYTAPLIETRDNKFIGYSPAGIHQEQDLRLEELDRNSVFNLLAAVEASFRVDFYLMCYGKRKDDLSRTFRGLYKAKGDKISFEEDILEAWQHHVPSVKSLLSELKGAFRYRHWLAHGRYWTPKLGKKYDFSSVYLLAQAVHGDLDLLSFE
jgi:hypothetical protein